MFDPQHDATIGDISAIMPLHRMARSQPLLAAKASVCKLFFDTRVDLEPPKSKIMA